MRPLLPSRHHAPVPLSTRSCRIAVATALAAALLGGAVSVAPAGATATTVAATSTAATSVVASDSFGRTVTGGWGVATAGGAWTTGSTTASTYSVGSGAGRQVVSSGQTAVSELGSVSATTTDVRVDVALNRPAGTGSSASASVLGRTVDGAGDYRARLVVTSAGALEIQVARGGAVLARVPLSGVTYASGARTSVRVEVTGVAPTTVRAKAWKAGAVEPAAWQVSATDSTAGLQGPGAVALSTSTSGATTPLTAAYYALRVAAAPPPNALPTAAFTAAPRDLTVDLDASASTDSDGSIASYAWSHGDGTTGTGRVTQHTYAAAGTYESVLTVTDDRGGVARTARTVTVVAPNVAPTAGFAATTSGLTVSLDASASSDPDGTVVSYTWSHGDGATGTGRVAQHTYAAAGTYGSVLTVTDDRGATATTSRTVTVTAPVAPRRAFWHPFASTSVWNTAVGSGAVFEPRTGPRTSSLLTAKPVINSSIWSTPVYGATTTDVLATLRSVRTGQSWQIRIPADATGAPGSGGYSDGHATIVQPDGRTAYDAYKLVKRSATVWEAQVAKVADLHGSGTHLGVRAAGTPGMAGLIRAHEVRDRRIDHALAIAVPSTVLRSGWVWPAKSQDTDGATTYSGQVPMGTLFAIPGSVNLGTLGLTPEGLALAKALQNYGAYVVDRAGMAALYCEQTCDATATGRMSTDWKVLQGHLRAVTNSTATSVGGGGTPRVPAAAPLG